MRRSFLVATILAIGLSLTVLPVSSHVSARPAQNADEQTTAVKSAAHYLLEHMVFPVTVVGMHDVLSVEVHAPIWNEWSAVQRQEFVDSVQELAISGSGGIAVPIQIMGGGVLVAKSVAAQGSLSMLVLKDRIRLENPPIDSPK